MAGKKMISLCLIFLMSLSAVDAQLIYDLSGEWKITNANGSISIPGQVPGSVHTALMNASLLSDPYYRFNDEMYRWVALDNWTYTTHFTVPARHLSQKTIQLVCEGLDTVANLTLNGVPIGTSTNMFERYVWHIEKAIKKSGENILQVSFMSPITYAANQSSNYPYDVPPDCPPPVQHGMCHPNFIRKEQCSFSWDWGPGFAPTGIWKGIYLEAFDDPIIRDVMAVPYKGGSTASWWLNITTYFDVGDIGRRETVDGVITVALPTLAVNHTFPVTLSFDLMLKSVQVPVPKAQTWWPNGYGDQPLYPLTVKFQTLAVNSSETSQKDLRVGFRKVELVQEKIENSTGLSFYFKINDKPIFIKGSNWIPADAFQERINETVLRDLLQSSADVSMNALRVWGGGIYEQDRFYEICDELGIMVWQDFMFACGMYPTDEDFRMSVWREVEQQVIRLTNHPSLMAWSANNENEGALRQNWYGTNKNFTLYAEDYVVLYVGVVWATVVSKATGLPFMSSSPSDGIETQMEGWIAKDPASVYYGDIHYYNYNADCWNLSIYQNPRFASEYGYQSWPSFQTLEDVSIKEDWDFKSKFSNHRQHHMFGQEEILFQIQKHFNLPSSKDSLVYYKDLLYLTQISQALCIKFETEHYRRLQSMLVGDGQGHCMGALYWQLNDIWQGASWSSIEYGGRWKMLHYYAMDFFAPILATGKVQEDRVYGYSVTDVANLSDSSFVMSVWTWSDFKPRYQTTTKFSQHASSSQLVTNASLAALLQSGGCGQTSPEYSCFITMEIQDNSSASLSPVNPIYLASFNEVVGLKKANISITSIGKSNAEPNDFEISLKSDSIAPFLWLDSGKVKGHFSRNGFLLLEPTVTVTFSASHKTSVKELTASLKVSSLMDIY